MMEAWDTGFYESSKCLRGLDEAARKELVQLLQKHIVEPVERIRGEGALAHASDNEFFDSFRIPLGTTVVFNTANPIERLQVYLGILGKNLAPKKFESHPNFKKAQFCVINNEDAVTARQEKAHQKTEAIGLYYTLLKSNKEKLFNILDYIGIVTSDKTDDVTLSSAFTEYVDDSSKEGFKNPEIFINTVTKFQDEAGENELYIYNLLKQLSKKGVVKILRGEVYLDDINLGNGFKLAAAYAASSPEINERLVELSEN